MLMAPAMTAAGLCITSWSVNKVSDLLPGAPAEKGETGPSSAEVLSHSACKNNVYLSQLLKLFFL